MKSQKVVDSFFVATKYFCETLDCYMHSNYSKEPVFFLRKSKITPRLNKKLIIVSPSFSSPESLEVWCEKNMFKLYNFTKSSSFSFESNVEYPWFIN